MRTLFDDGKLSHQINILILSQFVAAIKLGTMTAEVVKFLVSSPLLAAEGIEFGQRSVWTNMSQHKKELRMRIFLSVIVFGLAAGWATLVSAASTADSPEQQMQKCAVCKAMAAQPQLMKSMIWETHKIDNGMLSVASVPMDQKRDFDAVHEQMMQNVEKVKADQQQGKTVELCDYCKSMSELMKSGAKKQDIDTATGAICMVTSSDPTVVQKIHALADMAIAEQEKMQKEHQDGGVR